MVKISVIIPVYNVEKYLRECLDSVLANDFEQYEVICVCDAATDNSLAILEDYATKYECIKIVKHEKNRGLSAARNSGMEIAKGKYILFVDSDDMIRKETMTELYTVAERTNAQMVLFEIAHVYEENMEIKKLSSNRESKTEVCTGLELFGHLAKIGNFKVAACKKLYRRDFLEKHKLRFPEGLLHEDVLFAFQCYMCVESAIDIAEDYYIYRHREGSITNTRNDKRTDSYFYSIIEMYVQWCKEYPALSTEANLAIKSYVESIYQEFRLNMAYSDEYHELSFGTMADKTLFEMLYYPTNQYVQLTNEEIRHIKGFQQVIVYGAGHVALETIGTLRKNGIYPVYVAVSNKSHNPNTFCGIPVRKIEELEVAAETSCVVIATVKKYVGDIRQRLNAIGYNNIMEASMK